MKKKITIITLISILVSSIWIFINMPVKWYDQIGYDLVTEIQEKFYLGENIKVYHHGFTYFTLSGWKYGTVIDISEVKDEKLRNKIQSFLNKERKNKIKTILN